jgi:two-component system, cell cycle sensor histidine kinase and response regulator CckA
MAKPRTILLAEGEFHVRLLLRRLLAGAGYEVLEAADGVDALKVAEAYPFAIDLLLTGVRMPNMGGLELAGLFERRHPHAGVVFLSGYCDESAVASHLRAGRDAFVSKPFTPRQVLAAVQRVLARVIERPAARA